MTDKPTVYEAWSKVMEDVQAIGKNQTNSTPGQNYKFRGVDAVMNAVGPVLRQHKVIVVPEFVEQTHRDVLTTKGNPSREATVLVTYRVYGPAGDSFTMQAPGESMDSGDKGTPKAMSVAYRTVLLQALTIPTDEPDPDSQTYERATGSAGSDDDRPANLVALQNRLLNLSKAINPQLSSRDEAVKFISTNLVERGLSKDSVADLVTLANEWEAQK